MTSETLSQQEIDRLFSGGEPSPNVETPADAREDVQVYDFRRPNLVSKDKLRALGAKYGMLCKALESWLTARVRTSIDLRLLGVEQLSFGEFTLSLANPTASFVFDVANGSGQQVVIDFGRAFAFFLVDRLLGSNDEPPAPERSLTVLERMVVRMAADQTAAQLNEIWKDNVPLGLTMNRFEAVPELLRTANREDPMLVANIEVKAANFEGSLLICVPFVVLEKFFSASSTQRVNQPRGASRDRELDRVAAEKAVRTATVEITVRTPLFGIALGDMASTVPGTVWHTGLPAQTQLAVRIEGTPRFVALPGREGRTLAARVIGVMAEDNEQEEPHRRMSIMATIVQPESKGEGGMELAELEAQPTGGAGSLSNVFQVTLPVTIELGRTRMTVQDVLELGRGSVIALNRLVGEPVDVIVGDRPFAEGEVVVIGEQFGIRITRLHSQNVADEQP